METVPLPAAILAEAEQFCLPPHRVPLSPRLSDPGVGEQGKIEWYQVPLTQVCPGQCAHGVWAAPRASQTGSALCLSAERGAVDGGVGSTATRSQAEGEPRERGPRSPAQCLCHLSPACGV